MKEGEALKIFKQPESTIFEIEETVSFADQVLKPKRPKIDEFVATDWIPPRTRRTWRNAHSVQQKPSIPRSQID